MMGSFLDGLEIFFGWLIAASWQASVLTLFVLLVQTIFGARLNPRWRYALWLLVLLRLVLPALPESALSLFQFTPPPPATIEVTVTEPLFVSPAAALPPPATATELPVPTRPFTLYTLLAILWLSGAFTLFLLTWLVNQRFARQVAGSPAILDPVLLTLFDEARAELGIRRSIRLIESAQVQSPAIMGLFQPTLLLPAAVREKFDPRELRFIFLHELAHLKRGDVLVQALIAVLQILHWFNPVLWFAFRRLRIDREPATDALVLSRTGESEKEHYGLMLIKLLEHFNQRHSLPTLVGILEDKDQFKRRFGLIARFNRGAYGWSLLGALLIAILGVACLTKSNANETTPKTAADYIMRLGRFVKGVDSMEYSQTRGDPKGDHSFTRWQEMGPCTLVEEYAPSVDTKGKPYGIFHDILSYDGDHGYEYTPGSDRLRIQKNPFQDLMEGYSSGLEGPLLPFDFLDKRGTRSSSGRVTLQTLNSSAALAAVAARAVLVPEKNRSWLGHPCIAVKISDGNDRNDSQAVVDFIAYFARDLDFYPIAHETYKHGKLSQSYCVARFATLPLGPGSDQVFRYPELANGAAYNSDTFHSSSPGPYLYELHAAPDLKINTLAKADFTLKPPAGGYIEDVDTEQLTKVPSGHASSTAPNGHAPVLEAAFVVLPGSSSDLPYGTISQKTAAALLSNSKNKVTALLNSPAPTGHENLKCRNPAGPDCTITLEWKSPMTNTRDINVEYTDERGEAGARIPLDQEQYWLQRTDADNACIVISFTTRPLALTSALAPSASPMPQTDLGNTPTVQPAPAQVAPTSPGNSPPAVDAKAAPRYGQIEVSLKVVEIDDDVYQANKEKIDADIDHGSPSILSLLHNLNGVSILSTPSVTTTPGLKANVDIVREFPYPTSFDPAKTVTGVSVSGSGTNVTLAVPPTPREFAEKDIGISAEITPTFNDSGTSPTHGKIILNGKLSVTNFEGFTKSNLVGTGTPSFSTSESLFLEALDDRELKGIWVPGEHVGVKNPLAGQPLTPDWEATAPQTKKRYLLFVSATRV